MGALTIAAYDEIADWYENQFLPTSTPGDPIGIRASLARLLGTGAEPVLEVGCGTGVHAAQLRELGWSPMGVDLSGRMLAYANGRLPIAQGDATRLPIGDAVLGAVIAMMVHTDMPDYPAVLREVARVLRPGGTFVHVGVHPAFCGGFADRTDPAAVIIRPGYLDGHWTKQSWTTEGVRNRVGASHLPLPALLQAFLEAGLELAGFAEGGGPVPTTLSMKAVRRRAVRT
ncbi:class I SAM-dependent methyltransferase [Paractinoplanes ferrugineus]|uniref:Methyltransferase n=1 Tax=Paractinoplanes ferrugineus TaxID=113564 RepID=A0A919J2H9_9ACTN|nr:class I SAM-dependent methyltransferase [Actinoplanes ferrugineus]GIE12237.1 methyltransferase [Actinoplanes ferrugineus]